MKEFFEIIKKLWQNKRTRALAILILYVIFFIFVFSVISPSNINLNNEPEEKPKEETITDEFEYLNNIEIIRCYAFDINNNIVDTYNMGLVN